MSMGTNCQVPERAWWLVQHSREQTNNMLSGLCLVIILQGKRPRDKTGMETEHLELWGGSSRLIEACKSLHCPWLPSLCDQHRGGAPCCYKQHVWAQQIQLHIAWTGLVPLITNKSLCTKSPSWTYFIWARKEFVSVTPNHPARPYSRRSPPNLSVSNRTTSAYR